MSLTVVSYMSDRVFFLPFSEPICSQVQYPSRTQRQNAKSRPPPPKKAPSNRPGGESQLLGGDRPGGSNPNKAMPSGVQQGGGGAPPNEDYATDSPWDAPFGTPGDDGMYPDYVVDPVAGQVVGSELIEEKYATFLYRIPCKFSPL